MEQVEFSGGGSIPGEENIRNSRTSPCVLAAALRPGGQNQ